MLCIFVQLFYLLLFGSYIHYNELETIQPGTFDGLPALERLWVSSQIISQLIPFLEKYIYKVKYKYKVNYEMKK